MIIIIIKINFIEVNKKYYEGIQSKSIESNNRLVIREKFKEKEKKTRQNIEQNRIGNEAKSKESTMNEGKKEENCHIPIDSSLAFFLFVHKRQTIHIKTSVKFQLMDNQIDFGVYVQHQQQQQRQR